MSRRDRVCGRIRYGLPGGLGRPCRLGKSFRRRGRSRPGLIGVAGAIKRRGGTPGAQRQRGAVAVAVALMLTVMMGFCALAVDLALGLVARNELQNAADAAALAGAAQLYAGESTPDWAAASDAAADAIALNRSAQVALRDAVVLPGYWNLDGTEGTLQSLPATPGPADVAAVMVTVRRDAGHNGGPVPVFFARVWGINAIPVSASAVAAVTAAGVTGPGVLFPLAVSACLYRQYWDAAANPPAPRLDPATGLPYVFRIGPGYSYGTCRPGTWTSFDSDTGDQASLQSLLQERNPAMLKTGQPIWMQTGAWDALLDSVDACSARGSGQCARVIVPVTENVSGHVQDSVTAFACLRIELASSGGDNYVQAVMLRHCKVPNAGGTGPNYGALATPRLTR